MNKFLILLACAVSLVAAGVLDQTRILRRGGDLEDRDVNIARIGRVQLSRQDLLRQKFLLDVLQHVNQPLENVELLDLAKALIVDPASYIENIDEEMLHIIEMCRQHRILGKNTIFTITEEEHLRQLIGLYRILVRSIDWDTFQRNVCFARNNVNGVLFVNALLLAARDRHDTNLLIVPALHEVLPEIYYNHDLVLQASHIDVGDLITDTKTRNPNLLDVVGLGRGIDLSNRGRTFEGGRRVGMLDRMQLWMPWRELHMEMAMQKTAGGKSLVAVRNEDKLVLPIENRLVDANGNRGTLLTEDVGLKSWLHTLINDLCLEEIEISIMNGAGGRGRVLGLVAHERPLTNRNIDEEDDYDLRGSAVPVRNDDRLHREQIGRNQQWQGSQSLGHQDNVINVDSLPTSRINNDRLLYVNRRRLNSKNTMLSTPLQEPNERDRFLYTIHGGGRIADVRRVEESDSHLWRRKNDDRRRISTQDTSSWSRIGKNPHRMGDTYGQLSYDENLRGQQRSGLNEDNLGLLHQQRVVDERDLRRYVNNMGEQNLVGQRRGDIQSYKRMMIGGGSQIQTPSREHLDDTLPTVDIGSERLVHVNRRRLLDNNARIIADMRPLNGAEDDHLEWNRGRRLNLEDRDQSRVQYRNPNTIDDEELRQRVGYMYHGAIHDGRRTNTRRGNVADDDDMLDEKHRVRSWDADARGDRSGTELRGLNKMAHRDNIESEPRGWNVDLERDTIRTGRRGMNMDIRRSGIGSKPRGENVDLERHITGTGRRSMDMDLRHGGIGSEPRGRNVDLDTDTIGTSRRWMDMDLRRGGIESEPRGRNVDLERDTIGTGRRGMDMDLTRGTGKDRRGQWTSMHGMGDIGTIRRQWDNEESRGDRKVLRRPQEIDFDMMDTILVGDSNMGADSTRRRLPRSVPRMAHISEDRLRSDRIRSGEVLVHNLQQLAARINIERLALGSADENDVQKKMVRSQRINNERLAGASGERLALRLNEMRLDTRRLRSLVEKVNEIERRLEVVIQREVRRIADIHQLGDIRNQSDIQRVIGDILLGNIEGVGILQILREILLETEDIHGLQTLSHVGVVSLNDPLVQHFLGRLVGIIDEARQQQLGAAELQDLQMDGVTINSINVDKLLTYVDVSDVDLVNLLDSRMTLSRDRMQKMMVGRQRRLNHKEFDIKINLTADRSRRVLLRALLVPKIDASGRALSLDDQRLNALLLDTSVLDLQTGRNTIKRRSRDFNWTTRDTTPFTEIYRNVMLAIDGNLDIITDQQDLIGQNCRFPHRLLLPRGTVNGLPMQLIIAITPIDISGRSQLSRRDLSQGSMCGIGVGTINGDNLPLMFPLDRRIDNLQQLSSVPNLHLEDVVIRHEDKVKNLI